MKSTPIETLDKVLYFFDPNNRNRGLHNVAIKEGIDKTGITISRELLQEILYKLVKDEYLRFEVDDLPTANGTISDINFYLLTFEGELFQQNGGYIAKFLKEKRNASLSENELDRQRKVDERLIENTARLNALTFLACNCYCRFSINWNSFNCSTFSFI